MSKVTEAKIAKNEAKGLFTCRWCGKALTNEKFFINHLCTQKMRAMQKDDKHVKIGFMTWIEFRKLNKIGGDKTYEKFMTDKLYNSFVKFGKYCIDTQVIDVNSFIKFILKNSVRIDDWVKDFVYEQYLREWYRKQPPEKSVEQTLLLMEHWGELNNKPWETFFIDVNTNLAIQWIKSGRISPWIIYHANTSSKLFERLDEEQMEKIYEFIKPEYWKTKFHMNKEDAKWVESVCRKFNI